MFSNPRAVIDAVGVHQGMIVADFGAGEGTYARELAERVGDTGIVYAFDVQKDLVARLAAYARDAHITALRPVWVDLELPRSTGLLDDSIDTAFVVNTLFQIEDKESFLGEVFRVLRLNGRVLIIDWSDTERVVGPHPDHILSAALTRSIAEKVGLVFDSTRDAGAHQYGLLFRKKRSVSMI